MNKRLVFSVLATIVAGVVACSVATSPPAAAETKAQPCREPAVSGQFYPGDKVSLQTMVNGFLAQAGTVTTLGEVKAILSPHAGYVYSGPVAAYGYKLIQGKKYDVVIMLGNAHRVGFTGASVYNGACCRTPLGDVPVAEDITQALLAKGQDFTFNNAADQPEHSLEVQLPFLQTVLSNFKIVPILFGYDPGSAARTIVDSLPTLIAGKSALIVISSDLSHYPDYEAANRVDHETLDSIVSMDVKRITDHIAKYRQAKVPALVTVACGDTAIMTGIELAKSMGATSAQLLKYANSGDTSGTKDRVVGYGAVAFYGAAAAKEGAKAETQATAKNAAADDLGNPRKTTVETAGATKENEIPPQYRLSPEEKKFLLHVARQTLEKFVKTKEIPDFTSESAKLNEKRGAFVTLTKHKDLRGCIGYIEPIKPLLATVIENTVNAASKDYRFPPVTAAELPDISIEISALTPLQDISSLDEFVIGRDGIHMTKGLKSAVFLPQVAPAQGWSKEDTLQHLSQKAGLPPEAWKSGARFAVFQADVFGEGEAR